MTGEYTPRHARIGTQENRKETFPTFTEEQKRKLLETGHSIFRLSGQMIWDITHNPNPLFVFQDSGIATIEPNDRSISSEVAVCLDTFINPPSLEFAALQTRVTTYGKELGIPGVEATIGTIADYLALEKLLRNSTPKASLFGQTKRLQIITTTPIKVLRNLGDKNLATLSRIAIGVEVGADSFYLPRSKAVPLLFPQATPR